MTKQNGGDNKFKILKMQRSLNPKPELVQDELFKSYEFFDERDIVQVKYEMVRRVEVEGWTVSQAAKTFGFSRPSFYKAQKRFNDSGLSGLLPQEKGPQRAHKLTEEIMGFVLDLLKKDNALRNIQIAILIKERFGIDVHPRSIERALLGKQKKTR